ncbi:MAG: hypothetical protein PHQ12_14485 [Chthoniobacteraceae bacterium]|nr:hypothetical protein [Chthoniobacteraceae bacterium]
MTAQLFQPVFRSDVTVSIPGTTQSTPVAPKQVLSEQSAGELAEVLTTAKRPAKVIRDKSGAIIGHPITYKGSLEFDVNGDIKQTGDGATASAAAPHLLFDDKTIVNAGLLADYWVRNPPAEGQKYNIALKNALIDIEQEAANQGYIDEETRAARIAGITGENK